MTYREAYHIKHPDIPADSCYYTCPDDAGVCPKIDTCPHDEEGNINCKHCWNREVEEAQKS